MKNFQRLMNLIFDYLLIWLSGFFDRNWYLQAYPDVKNWGGNPIIHFLKHGGFEGRNPGPRFDTNLYSNTSFYAPMWKVNPLIHYLRFGKKRGVTTGILKEDVDPTFQNPFREDVSSIDKIKLSIQHNKNLSDEEWTKKHYWLSFGRDLDLENPKTFNEKISAYKLYYREKPLWKYADKFAVREFVREKVGNNYLIPLNGVYDTFEQIDFSTLPHQFVMKATHGSGFNMVCLDKTTFDWDECRRNFSTWLEINFFDINREWVYKNIKPRIVIEKMLLGESNNLPDDFKFYCFNGDPKYINVISERHKDFYYSDFFDTKWNKIPAQRGNPKNLHPNYPKAESKPDNLDEMINLVQKLSLGFPFVRVDLYSIPNIFFGELTFYPGAGLLGFIPSKWDLVFGDFFDIQSVIDNAKNRIRV